MISMWTNPIAIFIPIAARMTKQSQVNEHCYFVPESYWGIYREYFNFKILECLVVC